LLWRPTRRRRLDAAGQGARSEWSTRMSHQAVAWQWACSEWSTTYLQPSHTLIVNVCVWSSVDLTDIYTWFFFTLQSDTKMLCTKAVFRFRP
jgi:hypothetical protein